MPMKLKVKLYMTVITANHPRGCPGEIILKIKNSGCRPDLVGKGEEEARTAVIARGGQWTQSGGIGLFDLRPKGLKAIKKLVVHGYNDIRQGTT